MQKRGRRGKETEKKNSQKRRMVLSNRRVVLSDMESGSRAVLPLALESKCKIIKADDGDVLFWPEGKFACDYVIGEDTDSHGVCAFVELKDTGRGDQVKKAAIQIMDTMEILGYPENAKHQSIAEKRDFVFAAIAGAPDKTLPRLVDHDMKSLAKKLYDRSGVKVTNMSNLIFEVQPGNNCKEARIKGVDGHFRVECGLKKGAEIPFPKLFEQILKR